MFYYKCLDIKTLQLLFWYHIGAIGNSQCAMLIGHRQDPKGASGNLQGYIDEVRLKRRAELIR